VREGSNSDDAPSRDGAQPGAMAIGVERTVIIERSCVVS